jgi:DNA replication and repair protein RecF
VIVPDRAQVHRLELEQFRTYEHLDLHIPEHGLRISGPNGSGKTSIIEALLLVSTTRSRRGSLDSDLIRWDSGEDLGVAPYARVSAEVEREQARATIEIYLEANAARGTTRKLLKVSDRSRRASDVVGILPTVAFSPEDLDLVIGSPSHRRRWLDIVLSQADRKYLRYLSRYNRILSQRNGLLKQPGGQIAQKAEFDYWDEQLVGLGSFLVAARFLAARTMAKRAAMHFASLAPEVPCLGVAYESTLQQDATWWSGFEQSTANDSSVQRVGVAYEKRLAQSFQGDVQRGVTQVGPHRDDVSFTIGDRLLARFGSRGQQRLAVVALKLAEIDYLREATGAFPVFMLDDVLSELDPSHRQTLLRTVFENGAQMIVTATDEALLDDGLPDDLGFARLGGSGQVQQ